MFEEELYRHARYKAVGAKVGGALSSLELIRRLGRGEREAYFAVAKQCILERKFPEHWQQMVYVLLTKKHGDQRRLRKRREIALMDQTLKLMLKCVKRLSFDRMVGRTGEDNHGWVPGHGALNAALMMDVILGQARELKHSIYILFLDLKQFFPAIKRQQRTAAEYFIGLPQEVVRLAKAVFERMTAKFDTAHGLSDSFGILGGDLMGCVLSPSHARCLLTSVSVAIAAVSSGVRVWGCDRRARHVAQTMMADDWAGFNTTEESLQAQWAVWVDYAMASGSPIGVAGLEKTVVTAARFTEGKWVDVPVKLKIPRGSGGFDDLPEVVPQLPLLEAYPHMGILRSICGGRHHMRKKLRKGVAALVSKVRKVKFDKGQHIQCANCLKGSYVGYYAAAYGLTMAEAEELEKIWRAVFRMVFKVHPSTPTAHFYGGKAEVVADSLHGRHVIVDAVGALYSTCRRALASPEDSPERALARSALARRARKWGCTRATYEWLGSRQHLDAAVVMEREMESGAMAVEAFDFFILYTAWLTQQDAAIFQEKAGRGERPTPLRNAMSVEHDRDEWGEAFFQDEHSAWVGGSSRQLHAVLNESPPALLLLAGVTRVEHLCKPAVLGEGAHDFEFLTFTEFTKAWELPKSKRVFAAYEETCGKLRDRYAETAPWFCGEHRMVQSMVRPRTSRQLWDGVKMIGPNVGARDGWPVGDGCQARRGNDAFAGLLRQARTDGIAVSRERWAAALQQSYPGVAKRRAVEWWDGAPTDVDRHGTILVHVWPGAEHRTGAGSRVLGRRPVSDGVAAGEEERRREAGRWSVSADGDLLVDGAAAEEGEADGVPCIKLLAVATEDLKAEGDVEVDHRKEVTIRSAGEWAIHVESTRRTLEEWKELHALYDIQVAAATDGGRQLDEHGHWVASAAGYTSEGLIVGGGLDPELYPSSYECELRALIDVVKSWPDGRRALLAIDARSPVMAVAKFREAHVNKRAEYYQDDMLDELLRELERMEIVVFYWLKGHSGAVANEMADLQATRMLEEAPVDEGERPKRRHASLTFAFDRRPFRWAAERITRHVRERLQCKSTRSVWRDGGDWTLRWGRGQAKRRRILQAVQTKRLLLGDEAYYEGACGARAAAVRCGCGHGACSSEHWMFDCCLPVAKEQRSLVADAVEELGSMLASEGKQHRPTEVTVMVLRGRAGANGELRQTAFRWLVGCIPKPEGAGEEARSAASRALGASANSWRTASAHYRETKEQFLKDEKDRARAYRLVDRLRLLVALRGPCAGGVPTRAQRAAVVEASRRGNGLAAGGGGSHFTWRQELAAVEGRHARRLGCASDWLLCAAEWGAATKLVRAIRGWRRRSGRWEAREEEGALRGFRSWGLAVSRCPDVGAERRKEQRIAARLAREAKARDKKRQAAHFAMIMGIEGDGNITLASGLEDVVVDFSRRRRANWRAPGRRNRRRKRRKGDDGNGRRRASECSGEERSSDDSEDSDSRSDDGDDGSGSDAGFEVNEGDDGDGGEGGTEGVVVGDVIRIWWVDEGVWFRCRVVGMGRAGRVARVRYLVDDRWGDFYHDLSEVTWEAWSVGGEVDPKEAEYDLDTWVEPVDHEAAVAAEGGRVRRGRGGGGGEQGDGDGGAGPGSSASTAGRYEVGDGGGSGRTTTGSGDTSTGGTRSRAVDQFDWVVRAAPRGAGLKKRKALLKALAGAWTTAAQESGEDKPAAQRMAVYRVMKGTMTPKQVATELKTLARVGLVVVDGDGIRCGAERETHAAATDDTAAAESVASVDGAGGARRVVKRGREGAEGHDTSEMSDEIEEVHDGSTGGRRESRGRRRRRTTESYAESEQESDSSGADDWT